MIQNKWTVMFPVRRELVGKRFAFIEGDGRTGRLRGSRTGLAQNWNDLNWVTGTILASNVEGLDAQNESVSSKKVKVFVQYDSHYQLPKEWIKLYSGSHRIFLIEENLVLCCRSDGLGFSKQNYGWPALRLVPILDRNFLDENPHLIPVEFMGSKKQLSFVVFEDILQLFPSEDQTMLLQSVQQDAYLKSDYQSWERIQKTQMILLHGPYSLTGCRVEVNDALSGRCYRAVIISHDYMKRVLDVMDDQLLKSRKVNPKLVQINFLASDEEIDKLMYGEAPKAIPTRYSRYGHQVQPSRYQMEDFDKGCASSNQQLSQFNLPKWMANSNHMSQDQINSIQSQNNQSTHKDFQPENMIGCTQLSNSMKSNDERQLDATSVGLMSVPDKERTVIAVQNAMEKQEPFPSAFNDAQSHVSNETFHKEYRSAFTTKSMDATQHRLRPRFSGPRMQHSPVMPFSASEANHFGSSSSPVGLPVSCLDRSMPERPGTAPCIDTSIINSYPPSSTLTSPKGYPNDAYENPRGLSSETNSHKIEQDLSLGCHQSPHFTRDSFSNAGHSTERPGSPAQVKAGEQRKASLPEGLKAKDQSESKYRSSSFGQLIGSMSQHQITLMDKSTEMALIRGLDRTGNESFDLPITSQFASPVNSAENDLTRFLDQLDACFSSERQQTQSISNQMKNFSSISAASSGTELYQSTLQNIVNSVPDNPTSIERGEILGHIQQKIATHYPQYQSHDSRMMQEMYERHLSKQIFNNPSMMSLNQTRNCPSAPPSHMLRSLSTESSQNGSHTFGVSRITAPLKKPRARGRRKASRSRSKDDTSEPSSETSEKVTSILPLSSNRNRNNGTESGKTVKLTKQSGDSDVSDKPESDASKLGSEQAQELRNFTLEGIKNGGTDQRDNENGTSLKEEGESIKNEDMTARVALAVAGFNHLHSHEVDKQDGLINVEQKMPTGASWLQNTNKEVSTKVLQRSKSRIEDVLIKNSELECIDKPPSPEFLPVKDKDGAPLEEEVSSSGLAEHVPGHLLGELPNQGGSKEHNSFDSTVPQNRSNEGEKCKMPSRDLTSPTSDEMKLKNEISKEIFVNRITSTEENFMKEKEAEWQTLKVERRSEEDFRNYLRNTEEDGSNQVDDKKDAGLLKVPLASVPIASLGINLTNIFNESKKPGRSEKFARNIYGRTIYQSSQRGPNFAQQVRTDKIIGSVSSIDNRSEGRIEQVQLNIEASDQSEERQIAATSGSRSYVKDVELANQPSSSFSNAMHQSVLPQLSASADVSSDAYPDQVAFSFKGKKMKSPERRELVCKHKRKPCRCDLKKAMQKLASNSTPTNQFGSTIQVLKRLTNKRKIADDPIVTPTAISNDQSPLSREVNLPTCQPERLSTEQIPQLNESSFSILESKEISEKSDIEPMNLPLGEVNYPIELNGMSPAASVMKNMPPDGLQEAREGYSSSLLLNSPSLLKDTGNIQSSPADKYHAWSSSTLPAKLNGNSATDARLCEPRSSAKCKHKRRPCRCDIEAATKLSAYMENLKSSNNGQLGNYVTSQGCTVFATTSSTTTPSTCTYSTELDERPLLSIEESNPNCNSREYAYSSNMLQGNEGLRYAAAISSLPSFAEITKSIKSSGSENEGHIAKETEPDRTHSNRMIATKEGLPRIVDTSIKTTLKSGENSSGEANLLKSLAPSQDGILGEDSRRIMQTNEKCQHSEKSGKCEGNFTIQVNDKDWSIEGTELDDDKKEQKGSGNAMIKLHEAKNECKGSEVNEKEIKSGKEDGTEVNEKNYEIGRKDGNEMKEPSKDWKHNLVENSQFKKTHKTKIECGKREQYEDPQSIISEDKRETKELKKSGGNDVTGETAESLKKNDNERKLKKSGSNSRMALSKKMDFEVQADNELKEEIRDKEVGKMKPKEVTEGKLGVVSSNLEMMSTAGNTEAMDDGIKAGAIDMNVNEANRLKGVDANVTGIDDLGGPSIKPKNNLDRKIEYEDDGKQLLRGSIKIGKDTCQLRATPQIKGCREESALPVLKPSISKGQTVSATGAIQITVPASLSLSSNILNAPGNRVTARAKIVGPEKNFMPRKGSPVTVSFDGGKTFTLASIVEIRSGKDDGKLEKDKGKEKGDEISKNLMENQAKKTTTIDAELLDVRTSGMTKRENIKEGRKVEKKAQIGKKKKKIIKDPWETDDSSDNVDGGDNDPDFMDERKEKREKQLMQGMDEKQQKELRRSSRFMTKDNMGKEKIELKEGNEEERGNEEEKESIPVEPAVNGLFTPSGKEINCVLSKDDSGHLGEDNSKIDAKKHDRKILLTNKIVKKEAEKEGRCDRKENRSEELKKTTQTSKDEMFDCCAIHQDLFCQKCLPFRSKGGLWPVSSRAKEVNKAWRLYIRKCVQHECSKCIECNELGKREEREEKVLDNEERNDDQKGEVVNEDKTFKSTEVILKESIRGKENRDTIGKDDIGPSVGASSKNGTGCKIMSKAENEIEVAVAEQKMKKETQGSEQFLKGETSATNGGNSMGEKGDNDFIFGADEKREDIRIKGEHVMNRVSEIQVGEDIKICKKSDEVGQEKTMRRNSRPEVKHEEKVLQDERKNAKQEQIVRETDTCAVGEGLLDETSVYKERLVDSIGVCSMEKIATEKEKEQIKGEDAVSEGMYSGKSKEGKISKKCEPISGLKGKAVERISRKRKRSEMESEAEKANESRSNESKEKKKEKNSDSHVRKRESSKCLFEIPYGKCPIHGRMRCGACRPFYEMEGEWPCWARRGEVQFDWESRNDTKRKAKTVKCRIHLKANCPKCLPFRGKDGTWPSWLERFEVENYNKKLESNKERRQEVRAGGRVKRVSAGAKQGKSKKRGVLKKPNVSKKDLCFLHSTHFCLRCYEMRKESGKWPTDVQAVKSRYKKRQKRKRKMLEKWSRCDIHGDQTCLPCFNFWNEEDRAPREDDKSAVDKKWKAVSRKIQNDKCHIHYKVFCNYCTPVFITEKKFPSLENQLKSVYSWELFKDLLSEFSTKEDVDGKEIKAGNNRLKDPSHDRKLSEKVSQKFRCQYHQVFPCFVCMPKYVEDGCWPNEKEYEELWKKWTCERSDDINCSEHGRMFCRKCNDVTSLFEVYNNPGVTDLFLDIVKRDLQRKRVLLESRSLQPKNGDTSKPLSNCGRKSRNNSMGREESGRSAGNGILSVSSKGRIRSKVSRPGTVDISQLAEDFVIKESTKESDSSDNENVQGRKAKMFTKVKNRYENEEMVDDSIGVRKRKRGRPAKRVADILESVPTKRRRKKIGLVEQIRSGSLKLINVDDLREQLQNEHPRDPSPTHKEYIQLLENAEKMNVKYFAISAHQKAEVKEKKAEKTKVKNADCGNNEDGEEREEVASASEVSNGCAKDDIESNENMEGQSVHAPADDSPAKDSKSPGKFGAMSMWSERDIELILAKVEKAAEAAKAQKEEASHRRKQRQGKRPLTVAQVLAIKRNKGGDNRPVIDKCAKEDLEQLLIEAEERSVDFDTLLEEAIKTKDKEERRKQMAKQKGSEKMETFLQEKSCDQTPKLPKCRDCRVVDKRDADQHAFCRFVMFRRLFKRPKTGKVESAGFCSPQATDQEALMPWISKPSDVDMKPSVCHYIIKNIAGQFCAVVEEECQALLLGTKDGAVAWKRAVAGVREMCDACATTVFNFHWVCEKCGFGVCLDCFKSKISEKELKVEGCKAFEFHWFSCAPGLTHKPHNLTVTQIIPKDALWELCQSTVEICTLLKIPFKLSENMLQKSIPLGVGVAAPPKRNLAEPTERKPEVRDGAGGEQISRGQENMGKHYNYEDDRLTSQSSEVEIQNSGTLIVHATEPSVASQSISAATKLCNSIKESFSSSARHGAVEPLMLLGSDRTRCTAKDEDSILSSKVKDDSTGNSNQVIEKDLLMRSIIKNSNKPVEGQSGLSLIMGGKNEKNGDDDKDIYYGLVCKRALSIVENIKKWKCASELMVGREYNFYDNYDDGDSKTNNKNREYSENGTIVDHCGESPLVSGTNTVSTVTGPAANPVSYDVIDKDNSSKQQQQHDGTLKTDVKENFRPETKEETSLTDGCKGLERKENDILLSNKESFEEFQNSLDILAMVASGFFSTSNGNQNDSSRIDNKGCESIRPDINTKEMNAEDDKVTATSRESAILKKGAALSKCDYPVASYLCDGKLLQLNYSRHPKNLELFRSVWTKGFPLIVSHVDDLLDKKLWKPETFAAEFGTEEADVVNCRTGEILHQFSVGDFWKGFESVKDRPVDSRGSPMLLKLKDWPPGADFLDKMPKRFDDLMNAIPLPDYTRRNGQWNLVSRLPTNHFIKPDLGPKMYNAYGSAAVPSAGTTNLHLDMSDAVNVMVYVGVPRDPFLGEQEIQDALATVDLACCKTTIERVRQPGVVPGALWHIYAAEDADKIRKFLRKVAEEKKLKFSIHNDPIHDQSFYLDYDLRRRLKAEYDVTGFAICQCLGDAVFIPAGAPHQVLNLHSCVKVAEDFVSPERIGQCFNLTQEFRFLSDRHTNHEDKLQIKNIIYHSVKDSVAVLKEKLKDVKSETRQ